MIETVGVAPGLVVLVDIEPGSYVAEVRAINAGGPACPASPQSFKTETVFSPFDSSEDLVAQQYADFLGRAPDRAGTHILAGSAGSRS